MYLYLNWKSQKGVYLYLIFGLYLQMQSNIHNKFQQKVMFFTPGQQWAGSIEKVGLQWNWSNFSINEWMGMVNILGKDKGTQVSSSAGEELPTSWYSSTDKDCSKPACQLVYSSQSSLCSNSDPNQFQTFWWTNELLSLPGMGANTFVKYLILSNTFSNALSVSTFQFHDHT